MNRKITIIYWACTALFAFVMFSSAIPDVFLQPVAIKAMHVDLGYPIYFIPFIGVAKCLGAMAILIPGYPRIKEWAFAGLFFDLIGAMYSILVSGGTVGLGGILFMAIPIGLGIISYVYYHKKLNSYTYRGVSRLTGPSS